MYHFFISFKCTCDTGRTEDEKIARRLYEALLQRGANCFYSEEELNKNGTAQYMQGINQALSEAEIFILIATKPEYIESSWVMLEWTSYLNLMMSDNSKKLFSILDNLNPKDLPALLGAFQSFQLSDGIETIADQLVQSLRTPLSLPPKEEPSVTPDETDHAKLLQNQEALKKQNLTIQALAEVRTLLQPAFRNKIKLFKRFFNKADYQEILKDSAFTGGLAEHLQSVSLSGNLYDYLIKFYDLKKADPDKLSPGMNALYTVIKKKRKNFSCSLQMKGSLIFAVVLLIIQFHSYKIIQLYSYKDVLPFLWLKVGGLNILYIAGLLGLTMLLYRNHSFLFAQFFPTLIYFFLSCYELVTLYDIYYIYGFTLPVWPVLIGFLWLVVILIAAIISKFQSIRESRK